MLLLAVCPRALPWSPAKYLRAGLDTQRLAMQEGWPVSPTSFIKYLKAMDGDGVGSKRPSATATRQSMLQSTPSNPCPPGRCATPHVAGGSPVRDSLRTVVRFGKTAACCSCLIYRNHMCHTISTVTDNPATAHELVGASGATPDMLSFQSRSFVQTNTWQALPELLCTSESHIARSLLSPCCHATEQARRTPDSSDGISRSANFKGIYRPRT